MKRLTFMLIMGMLSSFHASTQTIYLGDTAFVTDAGHGGAPASCKANGMVYNSENMDRIHGTWVADVFTVPVSASWIFDTVILFGYQFGTGPTSTFTSCNLQIYNGTPGAGGTVIWGDTSTNVLNSTAFTGIYKVDTFASDSGLLSTKRPIMYLKLFLSTPPHLTAGTYWLSWSATCSTAVTSAATPYKVLPGRINPPGQKARVLYAGVWNYEIDNGDTAGFNMLIKARAGLAVAQLQNTNSANVLYQNIPNPFSSTTVISFSLAESSNVKLLVYNMLGQVVTTLADCNMNKGVHEIVFNASDLPDGTYYYKLSTPESTISKQMILVQ